MFFSPYNPSHCFHPLFSKRHPDIFPAKPPAQPQSPTAALGCISTLLYILSSNVSSLSTYRRSSLQTAPFFAFFVAARPDPFIKRTAPPYTSLEACGGAAIFLRQHRTIHGWRLKRRLACRFSGNCHKNAREYTKYSLRFLFNLPKNRPARVDS